MRAQTSRRRFAAIPLLALAFTGTTIPATHALDGPDLTQPLSIATDGMAPLVVAASPNGQHLYVANQKSNAITVIDTATNSQIKSIPLANKGNGVAVAPDGTVWATQRDAGTVAKIVSPLSASPSITYHQADAALAGKPTSVALSRSGDKVYVSDPNIAPGVSRVTALSTSTGEILHESAPIQNASSTISVAPDGSVWVAGDTPRVFEPDLSASQPMPGTSGLTGQVAFSVDGTTAYIGLENSIKVVDTASMTVTDTIDDTAADFFDDVAWLALSPDSSTLYAVNYAVPTMTVIDLAGALDDVPGSMTEVEGPPVSPGGDTAYLNSVVTLGNAYYVAVDGANVDGTTVMRYPVAPKVDPPATAMPGNSLVVTGTALVGAEVTIGGVPATTLASGYRSASVLVPNLSALASPVDVPIVVTTESGTANSQVDVSPAAATPRISGSARVGTPLTAVAGAWSPGTRLGYQWLATGKAISGATKATFTPTSAHVGKAIAVRVTGAYGTWGSTVRTSAATSKVGLGKLRTVTPKISGTPKVGRKVTARPGAWTPGTKFSYQWYAGSKAIKGATRSTLKISAKLKRKTLKVKVTGTKAGYAKVAKTSKATKKVK